MLILPKIFVSMFAIPEKKKKHLLIFWVNWTFLSSARVVCSHACVKCFFFCVCVLMGGGMRQAHVLLHISVRRCEYFDPNEKLKHPKLFHL